MTTLSTLRFKKVAKGMVASKRFGNVTVSVGFTPGWNSNAGSYYGDGRTTWEVAYRKDDEDWTVVPHARRSNVNAVLRNQSTLGRMNVAKA